MRQRDGISGPPRLPDESRPRLAWRPPRNRNDTRVSERPGYVAALSPQNLWRYFPWFITAAMSVVIAVNVFMAYTALHTFPGNAGGDGFDLSNHYNAVLERVKREAALGWAVQAEVDASGHPVIMLTDRSGAALAGAGIEATAQRPLGDPHTTGVRFSEISPGRYLGEAVLLEPGLWDLELSATSGGREFSATRRITVR